MQTAETGLGVDRPAELDSAVGRPFTPRVVAGEVLLRTSEIRYRRLFEAARDGILILDPATRKITDANPFMSELLGYPHDELRLCVKRSNAWEHKLVLSLRWARGVDSGSC